MSRIESRLLRLEAKLPPDKQQVPFLWCSDVRAWKGGAHMSIKQRLAKIEAHQTVKEYKGALSFTWESPADDPVCEAITQQAEAEDRLLIINRFVDPPHRGEEI